MVTINFKTKTTDFTMQGFKGRFVYVHRIFKSGEYSETVYRCQDSGNKWKKIFATGGSRSVHTTVGEQAYNAIKFELEAER